MARKSTPIILLFLFFLFFPFFTFSQIFTSEADSRIKTTFGDSCYIFCSKQYIPIGTLIARNPMGTKSEFTWEKYDTITASFKFFYIGGSADSLQSTISNLEDGCYKVTVKDKFTAPFEYKAWVLNNWIEVTYTEIPDSSSNCFEFRILADFDHAPLRVFDSANNSSYSIRKKNNPFEFLWTQKGEIVRSALSPIVYEPIASDTPVRYDLVISDEFKCTAKGSVDYKSKVTKASFTVNPMEGEAVLPIAVMNNSINYDSTTWFFYKELGQISREIEAAKDGFTVDSVAFLLYDNHPKHEYELAGEYLLKLVTVKINETGNCYDTTRFDPGKFIKVLDPGIEVPNFFTPNGDKINDFFVIKTTSLKSMTVKIYNRWGGLVHSWKYTNIRSSDYTYEHSVWDGRIGGRMATPGVYFYVVRAVGRDVENNGKEVQIGKDGFLHLFRDKK